MGDYLGVHVDASTQTSDNRAESHMERFSKYSVIAWLHVPDSQVLRFVSVLLLSVFSMLTLNTISQVVNIKIIFNANTMALPIVTP